MVETEIDPYPVSELTTRFGIGRTALYARLNALTIVPTKQGGKAFLTFHVKSWKTDEKRVLAKVHYARYSG